ncbi:MAG: protein translocase subunit SecDF [Bacteroidales bacterium]|jgi:SecD/SecF fusion protein|nr:protein translocase subunit SecDF [Bacteroidales bacterium]
MQNKGLFRTMAIIIGLICAWQLIFTIKSRQVENKAEQYAQGDKELRQHYLDSVGNLPVYNLGVVKYTYNEVKSQEINLGLDLKGGMNVTLEIGVSDLIRALANYNTDTVFNAALKRADLMQQDSQEDYVTLFGRAFSELDPNASLAGIFNTPDMGTRIKPNTSNADVLKIIRDDTNAGIANAFIVLRKRIDGFGVTSPNIQQVPNHPERILIELPGVDNPERVRNLLKGAAVLEFWETFDFQEVADYFEKVNTVVSNVVAAKKTVQTSPTADSGIAALAPDSVGTVAADSTDLFGGQQAAADSTNLTAEQFKEQYPLMAAMQFIGRGPLIGIAIDRKAVEDYLALPQVQAIPRKISNEGQLKFLWTAKQETFDLGNGQPVTGYGLLAIKVTSRDGRPPLSGSVITNAQQSFSPLTNEPEVEMNMNAEGAKTWARLTKNNIKKSIAIALDDNIISYPTVQGEIPGGRSQITGMASVEEAQDLANVLKSGKMPAPARIVQEEIIGPSLGQEAITSGLWSFVIAFVLVLCYMLFFYSKGAGLAANIALIVNLFFLVGILAAIGAVLTLPGIAGIVLTMGMAVDANVLIDERIQDELFSGKSLKQAVTDGYKNAYSAIIDGQLTTLLTGLVLLTFGSGPVKGFATTLIIGILTSLFTSIFITRLIFEARIAKGKDITFTAHATRNWLQNSNVKFLQNSKLFFIISGAVLLISIGSIFTRGFNYGIDFRGGRTYVVRFDRNVKVADVSDALGKVFVERPEIKTYGGNNQVKITTEYKIDDMSEDVDDEVESLLYKGLQDGGFIAKDVTPDRFATDYRLRSEKVGPTISDDIKWDATKAIIGALIVMFLYILLRFRNWRYGLGATLALVHDVLIVLGIFSLFYGIMPFSLEIDQAFIAAILTIVGYSINDTVVVFDRIREYVHLHPKRALDSNMNAAMNSTLRRTFSTSLSTLVVLFAIFFFGGTSIRGFTFALLIGVAIGTYSSICIASPLAYALRKKQQKQQDKSK